MLKELNKKRQRKKNTINLKYQSLHESRLSDKEKIVELQQKIISLQEDNDVYQKYIIEELETDIVKIKQKFKGEK